MPVTHVSGVQLTPTLLSDIVALAQAQATVNEVQVMAHCQVGRPLARAALNALVERGDLEGVMLPGGLRYQAVPPIDETMVRDDLMPGISAAVTLSTQTVGALAARFKVDVAVMDATIRTMQHSGQLTVTTVGATKVCRAAPLRKPVD